MNAREKAKAAKERDQFLVLFGSRIRDLREQAGLRQVDLAERLGMTRAALSEFEHGRRDVGVSRLTHLAQALGVSRADLLP